MKYWCLLALMASPALGQLIQINDLDYVGTIQPPVLSASNPHYRKGLEGLHYDANCAGETDPSPSDGYPGCLAGSSKGSYREHGMFDIPVPEITTEGERDLIPEAEEVVTLFRCSLRSGGSSDIFEELDAEPSWTARDMYGIVKTSAGGWWCVVNDWYNVNRLDHDSHIKFSFDSAAANATGAWNIPPDGAAGHAERTDAYLGYIPQAWANTHLSAGGDPWCFTGSQRAPGNSSNRLSSPALIAFPCKTPTASEGENLSTDSIMLLGHDPISPININDRTHPNWSPTTEAADVAWAGPTVFITASVSGDYWWYGSPDPYDTEASNHHRNECNFNWGSPDACFNQRGPALPTGTLDTCSSGKGYHAPINYKPSLGRQGSAVLEFYDVGHLEEVASSGIAISSLPGTCTPGDLYKINDGTDDTDCSTGSSSTDVICKCNGTGDGYDALPGGPAAIVPYATLDTPSERWEEFCGSTRGVAYDLANKILYWGESQSNPDVAFIHVYEVDIGGSYCGDTTCDAGEDECNCPDDCGSPPSETCTNTLDDDCDEAVDCDDPDCATHDFCFSKVRDGSSLGGATKS